MDEHAEGDGPDEGGPDRARLLFRYLSGEEWQEYRAILSVFAGTFFAEFTPDDVTARLADAGAVLDPDAVPDRLESLRRWGNLTTSTSVGDPASLADYYRRRNRYLITREGQEVHDLVEGVLTTVDQVRDVQSGRLRDLHRALLTLVAMARSGLEGRPTTEVVDAVRAVFDPHEAFTTEITQFFASLNQWQSRYDLEPDQLRFFAEVLVGYVSEQLADIQRSIRPIARTLVDLEPHLSAVVASVRTGLAERVDEVGLGDRIMVSRVAGAALADWDHLTHWFSARPGRRSRLDELTHQAVAAVRTLTANLTRLSGVGMSSASRRADFVRLARFFADAPTVDHAHRLAAAAFGLGPARHLGVLAADADNPAPTTTSWADAPPAAVPLALRERGEMSQRGRPSPVRDRSAQKKLLQRRREQAAEASRRTAAELLAARGDGGSMDGVELSQAAFVRLRDLVGRSSHRVSSRSEVRTVSDAGLVCTVTRRAGATTTIGSPEGRLRLVDLDVRLAPAEGQSDGATLATVDDVRLAPADDEIARGPAR
jgi:uncharacterized protein (TIGR02677 family)